MKDNIHHTETYFRTFGGVLIASLGIFHALWLLVPIGAVLFLTGLVGYCPIYSLLGVCTLKAGKDSPSRQAALN